MEGTSLISDALGRVNQLLHRTLDGVSAEMLCRMPTPETNSMAWLAWHLTRVQDHHMSDLAGAQQLWTGSGWHSRFGMAQDDKDTGTSHSLERVAAFKVDGPGLLLGYNDAVYERSRQYLAGITAEDLDRVLNEPQYNPMPTVGVRLVSVVSDNTQHAGQIAYVKGLLEGYGWQKI